MGEIPKWGNIKKKVLCLAIKVPIFMLVYFLDFSNVTSTSFSPYCMLNKLACKETSWIEQFTWFAQYVIFLILLLIGDLKNIITALTNRLGDIFNTISASWQLLRRFLYIRFETNSLILLMSTSIGVLYLTNFHVGFLFPTFKEEKLLVGGIRTVAALHCIITI